MHYTKINEQSIPANKLRRLRPLEMKIAKQHQEAFAQFFEKPTREGLRELISSRLK